MFSTDAASTIVLQSCYRCFCQLLIRLHRNILGFSCLPHLDIYTFGMILDYAKKIVVLANKSFFLFSLFVTSFLVLFLFSVFCLWTISTK